MRKTTKNSLDMNERLTINTKTLMEMLDCGRPAAVAIGEAAGARIDLAGRVLFSVPAIQKYIHDQLGDKGA